MTDLQLRILGPDGEAVSTYTDLEMGAGDVEADRQVEGGQVERDAVAVVLDVDDVAGVSSLVTWPAARLRAELRDTVEDTVVIDGTVVRTGVGCDDPAETDGLRRWTVQVVDTALDDLLDALAAVPLRSLAAAVEGLDAGALRSVETYVYRGGSATRTDVVWWSARRLLEAALLEAGATVATVPELFPLRFCYLDASGDTQTLTAEDRGYVAYVGPLEEGQAVNDAASTIPDTTGREWWETLRDLLGLTLTASYEPFPSAGVVATVTIDRWTEPELASLTALDAAGAARLALAGWDVACEAAESPGFAVRFANEIDPPQLDDETLPPVVARFASDRAVYVGGVSGADVSGATAAPLRQPSYVDVVDAPATGFSVVYGAPFLDGEAGEPYLAWLQGSGYSVALVSYDADTPAPGCPARVNPTWASVLFAGHALTASDTLRLQVELDLDVLAAAGGPAPELLSLQYAVEGVGWRTEAVTAGVDLRRADLTLVRPAAGYVAEAAEELVGPPSLTARLDYWERRDGAGATIDEGWEAVATARPGPGLSTPDSIEVEYALDDPPTWPGTAGTVVDMGTGATRPDPVSFRARSIYAGSGYTSDWVTATAA